MFTLKGAAAATATATVIVTPFVRVSKELSFDKKWLQLSGAGMLIFVHTRKDLFEVPEISQNE